ncbi:MAG: winged helix-turn-helix domain-containing protein [Tsuneonella suprasediminis]|uniref:DNA-binding response regulator n=1 Tax=Tsuneonella suprasediminis TaxID=2306996 RepID=A0A419R3C9_9SPHN|nr:response regulator transcription factor [Tsuneonella suprasediminis]RJX69035.1 DNA-binding response regulator [Tsuneonella suprasediminis]
MKILVAEDDNETAQFVVKGLRELGHVVDVTGEGREAFLMAGSEPYDVLVLDRMLPGMDGLAIIRGLRSMENTTPALFLTALDGVSDRVDGLEAGGDDYLVKPFAFSELAARVMALGRRPRQTAHTPTELAAGDLKMDLLARTVTRDSKPITLQPQEFRLLEFLLNNAGQIVTRTMLLEGVWGFHFDPATSIVETHISRLRSKLDDGFDQSAIRTVRGAGYIIDG